MTEIEVPTEHLHETIHEKAHEHHHASTRGGGWITAVALSTAMMAVLAAVSALLAGHHANEALLDQIRSSDQWSYYQAKGIKAAVLGSKMELLQALGKKPGNKDQKKIEEYHHEQEEIKEKAEEAARASEEHMSHHVILAQSVTLFQIAIAVAAISILTKRRSLWVMSVGVAGAGVLFLIRGLI